MNKELIDRFDYFFFDLDGTLIDTEKLYFRFWKEASKFYGYELSDEEALSFQSLEKGEGHKKMKEYSNGLLDYDIVRQKRIELMNEYFLHHEIEVKEGAKEFLELLKKNNKHVYIVTSNAFSKAKKIIDNISFSNLIDDIISAKDVERGKPFPDVYLKACESINKKPSEVIVFEDSINGLLSSFKAGCFTVMIEDLTKYNDYFSFVDMHVSSFYDLFQTSLPGIGGCHPLDSWSHLDIM